MRFVLPDLELATVMEEETVGLDDDDDENNENFLNNLRRRQNQCKVFTHYKPSDQYYRKRKNIKLDGLEDVLGKEDSIRKQVVSDSVFIINKIHKRMLQSPTENWLDSREAVEDVKLYEH